MSTEKIAQIEETEASESEGEISEYLTFALAKEEYGVDILRVQEIRGWDSVTRVPNSPEYVKGVMNLRGAIVPVVDLRVRFGLKHRDFSATTVVVVLRVMVVDTEKIIGIVVDGVSGVIEAQTEKISTAPEFGSGIQTEFIHGLVNDGEIMVMLLDVEKLLAVECISSGIGMEE